MKNIIMKNIKGIMLACLAFLLSITLVGCDEKEDEYKAYEGTLQTDTLKLTTNYENLSFLNDGIGEVKLSQNVDGDTAHFIDSKTSTNFTARFLCINTPESTGRVEAWGKGASKFTATKLSEADVIVCESKVTGSPAEKDTTMKRYLAYIWYKIGDDDFRLLNLELVEEGYTRFTDDYTQVKYGAEFNKANINSYNLKIRVFGEKDPNFDYSGDVFEVTIAEVKANFDSYSGGSTLKITARVMRFSGENLYIQDLNETENDETGEYTKAGIYVYSGYGSSFSYSLEVGQVITFYCQCSDSDTYGRQLTNPNNVRLVNEYEKEYSVIELESKDIPNGGVDLGKYEGFVVHIDKLLVTGKTSEDKITDKGAYTIYCQTVDGKEVNVRIDGSVNPKLSYDDVVVGMVYSVTGGVSQFHDSYQIMLGNQRTKIEMNDFVLVESK